MYKKITASILFLLSGLVFAIPEPPELSAEAYITIDFHTGEILQEKNIDKAIPIASVTKVMTAYVVFRELKSGNLTEDEMLTVSNNAWQKEGSKMFIEVGKQVSVEDLLTGLLTQSGNDAAIVLAEHIGGSVEEFAKIMTHYAKEIGMINSVFKNPTGLHDKEHLSTARDMALLGQEIIKNYNEYYHYFSIPEFTFNGIYQKNRNKLIHIDSNKYDGFKTGWHTNSGYCIMASAKHSERRVIMVVLNAPSTEKRFNDAQLMANYGLRFFENITLDVNTEDRVLAQIPSYYTDQDFLDVTINDSFLKTFPKDESEKLTLDIDIPEVNYNPVKKDDVVGKITVKYNSEIIKEINVVALNNLNKSKGLKYWFDYIILNWLN